MAPRTYAARRALTHAIFFLSGSAGLIYEVVWSRLLKEVFGVTAYAVAAVLATYLGGLALGAWALGGLVDRRARPLRFYGQLEICIGVLALLTAPLLRFFEPIDRFAATRLAPDSFLLIAIRLALASLVILPPTFVMGATLPAMTKAMVSRLGRLSRELAFLYALNTAGAVAGCLVAGALLIRTIGVHPSLWVAAGLNFLVGAIALALSRREAVAEPPEVCSGKAAEAQPGLLIAITLAGTASLALEVIWTRVLVLVLGGSTHAFVTMLAVFLFGIALGSFLLRLFVDRLREPRRAFGYLQAAIAISILAAIPAMNALVGASQVWLYQLELHWVQLLLGRFGIAAAIMIVPTTLIGMSFPLAARLYVGSVEKLGSGLGQVYGANTLGNIAGAVLGGFVLLPLVGMDRGLVLLTALNFAAAAWGFWPRERAGRWISGAAFGAAAAGVFAMIALWHPQPFRSIEEEPSDRTLFYEEGLVSTVKVLQRALDGEQRVMLVDNVRIGQSSRGVDYKQQVLAHFPFLLVPRIERVLSIGLGTGIAAGEAARHPTVTRLDCIELSPSVIRGAQYFAPFNGDVLRNPKVHVIADDGFSFLKRSPERYDAIVSDGKSQLGEVGNSTFFSTDFYRAARNHLTEGGLFVQWMPINEEPRDLRTIVRSFMSTFAYSYLWMGQNSFFLVGRNAPLALDLDRIQDELDAPATEHLRRHGWRAATDVVAMMVADRHSAEAWLAQETTVNSLERPVLEFYSMRRLATPSAERIAENVKAMAGTRVETLRRIRLEGPDASVLDASRRGFVLLMSALQLRALPSSTAGTSKLLMEAWRVTPEQSAIRSYISTALADVADDEDRLGNFEASVANNHAAIGAFAGNLRARLNLARDLAASGQDEEAMQHLRRALLLNPQSETAHEMLGELLQHGDPQAAVLHFTLARELAPQLPSVHRHLGNSLDALGRRVEALGSFREASRLQPDWTAPVADAAMLIAANPSLGRPEEALRLALQANALTRGANPDVLQILGFTYSQNGRQGDAATAQRTAIALLKASGNAQAEADATAVLTRYISSR
jgi:spermidine synthase